MKKALIISAVAAVLACACTSDKPAEVYIPKNTVEFAGNIFSAFSLGADVKLYSVQNPDNSSEWSIQAVVPVRKEANGLLDNLTIDLVPLDDRGVRVRDGLVLHGEDLANLIPVFNAGVNVERTIVFSAADHERKYMSGSEAARLLENTKGVRMDFNIPVTSFNDPNAAALTPAPAAPTQATMLTPQGAPAPAAPAAAPAAPKKPKEYPMTLDGLCRKHGVYGLLSRYETAIRNDNGKAAKNIEDQLWAIEKMIKNDGSIPKALREQFVDYIEDKEDEIEDRY
jgi:hypothetical protein